MFRIRLSRLSCPGRLSRFGRLPRAAFTLAVVLAALAAPLAALIAPALAEEKPAATDAPPQMTEEQMKQMMAMIQPGPQHAQLAKAVGTWKTKSTMWEPGAEPTTGEGSVTFETVLGGRYIIGRHSGNYRGMPFEGMSIDGYDNAKKMYISAWIDNFGTGMMNLTGQPAAGGSGIDLSGTMFDPVTGTELKVREEMRYEDDTKFTMTMFMQPPGGAPEMKVMEYTGVKQ